MLSTVSLMFDDATIPAELKAIPNWVCWRAVLKGKLASNPVLKLTMYKEPKGKTRFLSIEDEKRLLEKLGPTYGPWARLAILTGLRQAEQFGLQWKNVNWNVAC